MSGLGQMLIGIGLLLIVCGAVVLLMGRTALAPGRLPGNFAWRGRHTTVYFPLGTSIPIGVVLSLVLWAISKWK